MNFSKESPTIRDLFDASDDRSKLDGVSDGELIFRQDRKAGDEVGYQAAGSQRKRHGKAREDNGRRQNIDAEFRKGSKESESPDCFASDAVRLIDKLANALILLLGLGLRLARIGGARLGKGLKEVF